MLLQNDSPPNPLSTSREGGADAGIPFGTNSISLHKNSSKGLNSLFENECIVPLYL